MGGVKFWCSGKNLKGKHFDETQVVLEKGFSGSDDNFLSEFSSGIITTLRLQNATFANEINGLVGPADLQI
jgi:hypothetical protein